jgi:hypothetical protein
MTLGTGPANLDSGQVGTIDRILEPLPDAAESAMKRADLLHTVMLRARDAADRERIDCELRGAEIASPGEFVLTAWRTPAEVTRLAEALCRQDSLGEPKVIEEVGEENRMLHASPDAGRRRHLHIAVAMT